MQDIQKALDKQLRRAQQVGHRSVLACAGSAEAQELLINALAPHLGIAKGGLRVGRYLTLPAFDDLPSISASDYARHLGQNLSLLLFDAFDGLAVNALAALSGCLKGGGCLILCLPDSDHLDPECTRLFAHPYGPEDSRGLYLPWLIRRLSRQPPGLFLQQTEAGWALSVPTEPPATEPKLPALPVEKLTEQQQAIGKIVAIANKHNPACLLLLADRGRGKSHALGLAVSQGGAQHFVLTGPQPSATQVAQDAAQRAIPFTAADELIQRSQADKVLLIDEAAAMPVALLEALLVCHPRVVLATTLHGYEGSGQGFRLRFMPSLLSLRPHTQSLQLSQPVRWSIGDPLETFVRETLLLQQDTEQRVNPSQATDANSVWEKKPEITHVPAKTLIQQPNTLSQVFELLALAHYRTEPEDLRRLLDSPAIELLVAQQNTLVVGVALLSREAALTEAKLRQAVIQGERRPRGLLTPLTLCQQVGLKDATLGNYWRVLRIVMHPHGQRRGWGSHLLQACEKTAQEAGQDMLSASFSAFAGTAHFWRANDYRLLRSGLKAERNTGAHSLLVGKALNPTGEALAGQAYDRLLQRLPFDCVQHYRNSDESTLLAMLALRQRKPPASLRGSLLEAFAAGHLPYEAVEDLLSQWAADCLDLEALDLPCQRVWLHRVLCQKPWAFLRTLDPTLGKGPACQRLRDTLVKVTFGNN